MKKIKWLFVAVMSVFMVTGCSKTPVQTIQKANKAMAELSTYEMKLELTVGAKSSGIEMDIPITMDIKYDANSKITKMDLAMNMFGIKITTESYIDSSKKTIVTYSKNAMTETWEKEVSEVKEDSIKELSMLTKDATKVEKKETDGDITHYLVTIDKNKMQAFLERSMEEANSNEANFKIAKDIVADVYVNDKNNYITKMEVDLKDAIQLDTEDEKSELTKFKFTLTFDQFNKIEKIEIPKEVIESVENATSEETI